MRGDFSRWYFDSKDNFSGVLHQQGRVLLDGDWNAETSIINHWQDTAGRDIIGPGVAAVPSGEVDNLKILAALVNASAEVELAISPGRVWVDGILTCLPGEEPDLLADVHRIATYLQPPIQSPSFDESTIGEGVRDAVILEVWREEINGFQMPDELIEPALGGPDTTERILTAMAFRLFRLGPEDTCENIGDRLTDDFSQKGKLKVSLEPPEATTGDCPTAEGGGYTGFEHNLYRIEIAQVESGSPAMFKWSQFNGGLVGRGIFDAATLKVTITANLQAIITSGLTDFYLEAVEYDSEAGKWKVTYGAKVTLNSDNEIDLPVTPVFGLIPATAGSVFFRLWNDIRLTSDFPQVIAPTEPTVLRDGIRLEFEPTLGANYFPGDYWTFPVRAGEIKNPEILIDYKAPEGIHYHRVSLAILNWDGDQNITAPEDIEDCRRVFQPLTRLSTCCTYRVGDGMQSHGDFDLIQDAINHLPEEGGEVCVLPGIYTENIVIESRVNITVRGCGERSRIVSAAPSGEFVTANPVIHISNSEDIKIEFLAVIAHDTGIGILLEDLPPEEEIRERLPLREITLYNLHIAAAARCGIEVHGGSLITISGCIIEMNDVPSPWPGIYFIGEDSLIENNMIRVKSLREEFAGVKLGGISAAAGLGGLQIGGTSEGVRIINNLIQGGIGNGITLGSIQIIDVGGNDKGGIIGWVVNADDRCSPCKPGDVGIPPRGGDDDGTQQVSAGDLFEILIERNRIFDMGLNGVGVIGFFNLDVEDEFITVERLTIIGNDIRRCLRRPLAAIPADMVNSMGYGGISLADVEYLVIHDNVIEDNGPNHLEPICGIFVLHGEGIDISRNRILNNGEKTDEPAKTAKIGRRGGINIVFGIAPTVPVVFMKKQFPTQDGVPAVRVHDNIVSVPLGQALSLTALGPVSVVGNQFTSRGMVLQFSPISPTFIASTVMILNLGVSNELYGQLLAFNALRRGQSYASGAKISGGNIIISKVGLDDRRIGQYLANGNVLFSNNQCVLDLIETGFSLSISSVLIVSLDDVGFHSNQCDCSLADDLVLSQAVIGGFSVRVSDNRLKEGIFNALYSAITLGVMNATTNNQSTHCIIVSGLASVKVDSGNKVFLQITGKDDYCNPFSLIRDTKRSFGQPLVMAVDN